MSIGIEKSFHIYPSVSLSFYPQCSARAPKVLAVTCGGFDVEEIAVDVYYHCEHSTKRNGELKYFASICDVASTRWLSLQASVEENLQYTEIRSYFC